MSGYTKLFGSILASTVWELPVPTKVVWITMLAMSDRHGEVQASIPGLAKLAGVTIAECEAALQSFLSADPYSRTKEDNGRRIREIDGGWYLINHRKYTQTLSDDDRRGRAAVRQQRFRESHKVTHSNASSRPVTDGSACNDTQTQTQTQTQTPDRIPPAPRVKTEKPAEQNQFEQALADFNKPWQGRYHRPYVPTAADKNQLGRFWQKAPEHVRAQWPRICRDYVGRVDVFFIGKTASHSLRWLVLNGINEFTGPAPPSKEAIAAADQARHQRVRASERTAGPSDLGGLIGNLTDPKAVPPEEDEEAGRARAVAQLRARGIT